MKEFDKSIDKDMLTYALRCYDKEIEVIRTDKIAYKGFVFIVSLDPINNTVKLLTKRESLFKQFKDKAKCYAWEYCSNIISMFLLASWEDIGG